MGFISAIPVGASQIEIAKRVLNHFSKAAIALVLGSMTADLAYGLIAFFGVVPVFKIPMVAAVFKAVNVVILAFCAVQSFREGIQQKYNDEKQPYMGSKRRSFTLGFALSAVNFPILFWWLIARTITADAGIDPSASFPRTMIFLGAGILGLMSYLFLLIAIIRKTRHLISKQLMRRINILSGFLLACGALYFVISFISLLPRTFLNV